MRLRNRHMLAGLRKITQNLPPYFGPEAGPPRYAAVARIAVSASRVKVIVRGAFESRLATSTQKAQAAAAACTGPASAPTTVTCICARRASPHHVTSGPTGRILRLRLRRALSGYSEFEAACQCAAIAVPRLSWAARARRPSTGRATGNFNWKFKFKLPAAISSSELLAPADQFRTNSSGRPARPHGGPGCQWAALAGGAVGVGSRRR